MHHVSLHMTPETLGGLPQQLEPKWTPLTFDPITQCHLSARHTPPVTNPSQEKHPHTHTQTLNTHTHKLSTHTHTHKLSTHTHADRIWQRAQCTQTSPLLETMHPTLLIASMR